jgi:hypothetical protein
MAVSVLVGCSGAVTAPTVSSVTYNGVSLSQTEHVSPATSRLGDVWQLPAGTQPATGANNVVVTFSGSIFTACVSSFRISIVAWTASGVDQTTNYTDTNTNSGTGTSGTLTMTGSGASDAGFHHTCQGDNITSTTETEIFQVDDSASSCNSAGGATAAAADTSWSWTYGASDSWIMVGGVFKATGGGGGGTPKNMTLLGVGN